MRGVRKPPLSGRGIFRFRLEVIDVYRNLDCDGIGGHGVIRSWNGGISLVLAPLLQAVCVSPGSGRRIHRPYWTSTLPRCWRRWRRYIGPVGKVHFVPLGMRGCRTAGGVLAGMLALALGWPATWLAFGACWCSRSLWWRMRASAGLGRSSVLSRRMGATRCDPADAGSAGWQGAVVHPGRWPALWPWDG